MKKPPAIKFKELERQVLYHELRVFIAGAEVTADLRDAVTSSLQNIVAATTSSFTLDNAGDKYVITQANAAGRYGVDAFMRYDERAKQAIVNRKLGLDDRLTAQDARLTIQKLFDGVVSTRAKTADTLQEPNRATDDASKRSAVAGVIDETFQRLGPQFFSAGQTDATRTTVLANVVKAFPSLGLQDVDAMVQRGHAARNSPLATSDVSTSSFVAVKRDGDQHRNPKDPAVGQNGIAVWDFVVGDLVINKHDPVVIWAHNPLTENDEWYRAFRGFINTVTEMTDETTGESRISVSCYCIRQMMSQMRVAKNMAIAQIDPELFFQDNNSFFNDLLTLNTDGTSFFAGGLDGQNSLEELVSLLVLGYRYRAGQAKPDAENVTQSARQSADRPSDVSDKGVGRFRIGEVLTYPPDGPDRQVSGTALSSGTDQSAALLDRWHTIVSLGSPDQEFFGGFPDFGEVTRLGHECFMGGEEDPWRGRLHMLLPQKGTDVRQLEQLALDASQEQFQFSDRLSIIKDLCSKLHYQFYSTPAGDLVLEFPMYDFAPEHFGTEWARVFTVMRHAITSQVTPEAEIVPFGVVVKGKSGGTGNPGDTSSADDKMLRAAAYSKIVGQRFGVGNIEMLVIPWLDTVDKVAAWAVMEYQRRLFDASSASFTAAYRPFMGVNRPVLLARRGRLGVSESVETTWNLAGEVSNTVNIRAIRKVVDETINGQVVRSYRFVTGGESAGLTCLRPDARAEPDAASQAAIDKSEQAAEQQTAEAPAGSGAAPPAKAATDASGTTLPTNAGDTGSDARATEKKNATKFRLNKKDREKLTRRSGIHIAQNKVLADGRPTYKSMNDKPANLKIKATAGQRLTPETVQVAYTLANCAAKFNREIEISQGSADPKDATTKARQSDNSQHYSGEAFDLSGNADHQYSRAQKDEMAACANRAGYDFVEEIQPDGPHLHVQKNASNVGQHRVVNNKRAAAAAQRARAEQKPG